MTRCRVLVAAAAALVASALAPAPVGAQEADPMLGAPAVGQCYDLGADELAAAAYTEAPVDCAGTHTSRTVAVSLLPDGLAYDSRGLERFALESCFPAQRRALGTTQLGMRLTAYGTGWWVPTAEQQAAGARWVRCDLVLGSVSAPQPLPSDLAVGRYPYARAVSRCLAGRDHHVTSCASRHTHRATAAVKVRAARYPSERAWQRLGVRRCRDAVASRSYRFGWPSAVAWRAGDHTLICYSQSRR